jgi:hypothetical protein
MNACSNALPRNFREPVRPGDFARSALLLLGALLMLLLMGGCSTMGAPYAPESSLTARQDLETLKKHFNSATMIEDYFSGPDTKEARNKFIAGRLVLYDLAYADWISRFRFGRAAESTILDTASLGITQAITLIGGVETKEALGAIGTAILGTRSSYEKNFYDEQAAGAITAQMNAERKAALIPIMAGTRASIDDYPFNQALVDLNAYQYAGTIDGALSGIQREAGIKETKAMAVLDQYREGTFGVDDATTRLLKYVFPGMDRFTNGAAYDAGGNTIALNQDNLAKVRAELANIEPSLARLATGALLTTKELAPLRARIVANLSLP